jgi:DNA primase
MNMWIYMEKKEFLQYIKNNKVTNIEYKINNYIRNHAIHDLKAKVELLDLVGNDILNLTSEIEKDFYIKNLARKLQIEEGLVLKEINKQGRKLKGIKRNKTQINRDNINYGIYSIEEKIIAQMVIDEQFFDYIEKNYNFKIFSNNDYYHIIDTLSKLKGKGNKMQLLGNELNNEKYGPT